MSFQVPRFRIITPPGSSENGTPLDAHWIVSQNATILAGDTLVVISSFVFPQDAMVRGWMPFENHHTKAYAGDPSDPDGIGWPEGVSPMQIDLCNGYLKVYTKGGGTEAVVDGVLQPTNVIQHEFPDPADPSKRLMLKAGVRYDTISRTTHDWDAGKAHVEVWAGEHGTGPLPKYVDEHVPLLYTNERMLGMYTGWYTDRRPGHGNDGKTFDFIFALPRMAKTFDEARVLVPTVQAEWGALSVDTTEGLVNGHLPPYDSIDSEDIAWPTELLGPSPSPVPVPVTYMVEQTWQTGKSYAGLARWTVATSDDADTAKVEFWLDGVLVHTETTAPYGCTNVAGASSDAGVFDTSQVADGDHVFRATATRSDGIAVTTTANVTIQNRPVIDVAGALGHAKTGLAKMQASADYKARLKISPGAAFAKTALGQSEKEQQAAIKALGG